jgi:putative endonuclease
MKKYYVYIMASKSGTLYTGMTVNLKKRVYEHKHMLVEGFTKKYGVDRLVYFEESGDVQVVLEREKEIKGWLRKKKITMIESSNPEWKDLSEGWF